MIQPPTIPSWTPPARNLSALLSRRLAEQGHAPFLTFYDDGTGERTELSYATFENWVAKTANLLVEELDVTRGTRVATVLGNHWTTVVVTFACWKVGACVVPCEADAPVAEARAVVEGSGCVTAFVREDLVPELDTLTRDTELARLVVIGQGPGARLTTDIDAVDVGAEMFGYAEEVLAFADDYDDPAVSLDDDALLATPPRAAQGPAAVRLTQGNLLAAADALCAWGLGSGDRILCAQPVQLVDGLALAHLAPLHAGGSTVLTRFFDRDTFWRRVADERVTLGLVTPSVLDDLADRDGGEPPPLRAMLSPSGVATEVARRAGDRLGVPVRHGHGAPEAACASAFTPVEIDAATAAWVEEQPARTVGCATARAAVAVLDDAGAPAGEGVAGGLAVAGPVVSPGYDGHPELDEARRSGAWLRTGERAFQASAPDGRTWVFVTG